MIGLREECLHGIHPVDCDLCKKEYNPYDLEYTRMKVGDHVEFLSDQQTEKGPSTGLIKSCQKGKITIQHSDCTEEFKSSALVVSKKTLHKNGGTLWFLK